MSRSDATDLGQDLGRRLAILRESRDLSQAELARQARITPSSLSLYEAGKKIPELATLFRILDALDYGLAALDRADELCLALRLTLQCRRSFGLPNPLRGQIASLAAEAGNAADPLPQGRGTAEGHPGDGQEARRLVPQSAARPQPEVRHGVGPEEQLEWKTNPM